MRYCAQGTIDVIGVKSPLRSINIITKKKVVNTACWSVDEKLETKSPNPAMKIMNSMLAA